MKGQSLAVLYTLRTRTGLFLVCEVEGRRRVTVRQEWTDRGVPPSADRLTVDGLSAARALVDAINPGRTDRGTDAPRRTRRRRGQPRAGSKGRRPFWAVRRR